VLVTVMVAKGVVVAADVAAAVVDCGGSGGVAGVPGGGFGHLRKQTGGDIFPQRICVQIVRMPPSHVQRLQPS